MLQNDFIEAIIELDARAGQFHSQLIAKERHRALRVVGDLAPFHHTPSCCHLRAVAYVVDRPARMAWRRHERPGYPPAATVPVLMRHWSCGQETHAASRW